MLQIQVPYQRRRFRFSTFLCRNPPVSFIYCLVCVDGRGKVSLHHCVSDLKQRPVTRHASPHQWPESATSHMSSPTTPVIRNRNQPCVIRHCVSHQKQQPVTCHASISQPLDTATSQVSFITESVTQNSNLSHINESFTRNSNQSHVMHHCVWDLKQQLVACHTSPH